MDDTAHGANQNDVEIRNAAKPLPHWEQRDEIGIGLAFVQTFGDFYAYRTRKTYLQMPIEGSVAGPLLFAIAAQLLFSIVFVGTCWLVAWKVISARDEDLYFRLYMDSATLIFTMPIAMTIVAIVASWLSHGILVLSAKEVGDFRGTVRCVYYAFGAAQLLNLVPFVGLLAGWIWLYGTGVIGLRAVHGVQRKWAILAMFPVTVAYVVLVLIEHNLIPPYLR